MDQSSRIAEFDRFKKDEINVLVASDVAARGLDVKGVSHVINFDVPWQPDDYIHRIGRTGRAGAKGIAITLATREDGEAIAGIEKLTGIKLPRVDGEEAKAAPAPEEAPREEKKSRSRSRAKSKAEAPAPKADAPREERPAPKGQAPRDERPTPKAASKPKAEKVEGDDDWNGPVPGFLNFSAL
jgi:superfamily II DNA/RNA helicase